MTPQHARARHARIVTPPPGPASRALVADEQPHLAPGSQYVWQLAGIAADHGDGAILEDVDGNRYIDLCAGIGVASLGYGHPGHARAISEQSAKLVVGSYTTAPRRSLLHRIAAITPPGLVRTQLYSSGAEAVESALRLARAHTKKWEVVSFWGGFHGKTQGVLGLMGSEFKHGLGPQAPGLHLVPYADCYRCPFKLSYPKCGLLCVDFARDAIRRQTTGAVAAIVVEPIQGTAGNVVPPPDYLPAIAEVARENGALLIADEMITGFGRTGKMFGCEHSRVTPDIMTIGKGLGAGFPITGVVSTDAITHSEPWAKPSFSSSSYGGNPLAAAAADATLAAIAGEGLVANTAFVGEAMLDALRPFVDRYPFVGEVRGKGLMIGLELVADKKTRAPLAKRACEELFLGALRRGVITMAYAPRVRINPPLVLTHSQALEAIDILREVFDEVLASGAWR